MIGKTISHYRILEKLGAGGMGVVYKAQDTKLDRFAALKFLPPHLSQAEEEKQRFIHEAKTASALNHPNIATIYEIDEADGQMFIAMEYIEGKSLQEIVGARHVLPLPDIIDYAIQITEGLQAAHKKGIIHRDIKPANILINDDGVLKIVDFGLAKLAGSTLLTKEGTTLGTVAYMSPEQAQGAKVDHRTDIWALGSVLYEMITGRQPFAGDYEQAVMYSIMNEEPEPIIILRSDIPTELQHMVQKAMQKDAGERYQQVNELLAELKSNKKKLESKKGDADGEEPSPSIAVLPFVNMSADPENEYFSDGLSEELINALTKLEGLHVVARTSAFRFRGKEVDIRDVGKQLNVSSVLEGSVRKSGNRLRITAELINVADGYHIWSERYDREMEDVFAIQDEISQAIVDTLKVKLLSEKQRKIPKRHFDNLEAYDFYWKGRFYLDRLTEEDIWKSVNFFEKAIEVDSGFAMAHAGLADAYVNLTRPMIEAKPPKELLQKAKAAAEKALKLDNGLAEAHASLALVKWRFDLDWSGAAREFTRAIQINPGYATAYLGYGYLLMNKGNHEKALTYIARARELDPLSVHVNVMMGLQFFFNMRQFDRTIEYFQSMKEMNPKFWTPYFVMAISFTKKGEYKKAFAAFEKALAFSVRNHEILGILGWAKGLAGKRAEAGKILNELTELSKKRYVTPISFAHIHLGLGDADQALDWIEQGVAERAGDAVGLKANPVWDDLRSEPRFVELVKKIGLEP